MNTERDVVRVYSGPVVQVELYQQVLSDAGIASNVVGLDLAGGVGSALQNSVELWVKSEDAERAAAAIWLSDEKPVGG
jgi:hypothetical protein